MPLSERDEKIVQRFLDGQVLPPKKESIEAGHKESGGSDGAPPPRGLEGFLVGRVSGKRPPPSELSESNKRPAAGKGREETLVWWGDCARADIAAVKQVTGGRAVYNAERRVWGTTHLDRVAALIHSGKWFPEGIDESLYMEIARRARILSGETGGTSARDADDGEPEQPLERVAPTRVVVWKPFIVRACPGCKSRVFYQFLECSCQKDQKGWWICDACNALCHPRKLPTCACPGGRPNRDA